MGRPHDLTGKKYNRLTVISKAASHVRPSGTVVAMWNCMCDCGNICVISADSLRRGTTKSCGCYNRDQKKAVKNDLSGRRFGRLAVICRIEQERQSHGSFYKCICDCGNEIVVKGNALVTGNTMSCGCLFKDTRNRMREKYKEVNGYYPDVNPNEARWIFLDGNKENYDVQNVVFLTHAEATRAHSMGYDRINNTELKRVAMDVIKYGSLIKTLSKNKI